MSGLFGGKKSQSTTSQRLNGVQINQSVYGNAVPLVYGTTRIPLTLIDYVDFNSQDQTDQEGKGGGSKSVSSTNYSASIIGLLCEGPITGVASVLDGSTQTTLTAKDLQLFLGQSSQAAWTYMVQRHPDHAIPYDRLAYVAGANFALGSSASLPNLTFEVQGLLLWSGGPDAEPSQIVKDYCTDPIHGCGFPYVANLTSGAASFQNYCLANNLLISPQETTQRPAQDFLTEILMTTNSNSVFTAGVGLRIVPYGDQSATANGVTYTPNLTPEYSFSDADYCPQEGDEPIQRTIVPVNQTFNVWRVEFLERANQYNVAIAEFRDEQDIAINGRRVASTVSLHSITVRSVAMQVAALLCFRSLYIRSQFQFRVRADYSLLEPMDLVAINDTAAGITNQLVRIIATEDDQNDVFTITAEEMLVGPASAPLYDNQLAAAYAANYLGDPGSVQAPYVFTAPPMLIGPSGGYELWIAVNALSGVWGGADVYASLDNVTYEHVGVVTRRARYGRLVNSLPSGTDPDTADLITVAFTSAQTVSVGSTTRAGADALRTLAIVDGEIISYQTATALGNNTYTFTYLRRGLYGSTIKAHGGGSFFAILDDAIFRLPFNPGYSGLPVWLKFASFNYYGLASQDLSSVTAYQATFQGQNSGQVLEPGAMPLIARGTAVYAGARIFKSASGALAWDSDCYSPTAFSAGAVIRFRATRTDAELAVGLNSDPLKDGSYASIDYAWNPSADGRAYIYESGAFVFVTRAYTTSDTFELRYDGKFVSYYLSGVLWRRTQAQGQTLAFDSAFYTPGGAVDNVFFGSLNPANTSPFNSSGAVVVNGETATKLPTGASAWDSDFYSLEGFPSCHITFKPNDNSASIFMLGLGTKPAVDASYTSLSFAWYVAGGQPSAGRLLIYESGTDVADYGVGQYDASTVFSVTYDGLTVRYLKNSVVIREVPAAGLTLFADSSFYAPGSGVNSVQFGPTTTLAVAETSQLGPGAATGVYFTYVAGPVSRSTAA